MEKGSGQAGPLDPAGATCIHSAARELEIQAAHVNWELWWYSELRSTLGSPGLARIHPTNTYSSSCPHSKCLPTLWPWLVALPTHCL